MRVLSFLIAVLALFAVLGRTVWIEAEIRNAGYEIRRLRESCAEMRNRNRLLRASIANELKADLIKQRCDELNLGKFEYGTAQEVVVVPLDEYRLAAIKGRSRQR